MDRQIYTRTTGQTSKYENVSELVRHGRGVRPPQSNLTGPKFCTKEDDNPEILQHYGTLPKASFEFRVSGVVFGIFRGLAASASSVL